MRQRVRTQALRLLVVCMTMLVLAETGGATGIQVLPGDTPLKIRGRIGDDSTFVKRLGLVSPETVSELIFRSTDLLRTDGREQVSRQQVAPTSTAKIDLARNTPKDVEIRITGIKLPGTYTGTLYLLQPEQGLDALLTLPIEVTAEGVPELTQRKGSEAIKIQLVDCAGLGCTVARVIQPGAFLSTYPLAFDNASLEPFEMTSTVNATGEITHGSLGDVLTVQSPVLVPVQPVFTLPIEIQNPKPLPDHYVGDVQLKMALDTPPLKIPLEVNVRTGPFWPFFVLLAGVLLGRLLKYMKDKGTPQSDLLLDLYHLESRIASSPDAGLLQPMLDAVKALIYGMQLDDAKKEMAGIENRAALLTTLRGLELSLLPRASEPAVSSILSDIGRARILIGAKQDQDASAQVVQIQAAVQGLPKPAPALAPAHAMVARQAQKAVVQANRTAQGATETPAWYVRLLGLFTGINRGLRAELTLWVLRPTIYLLLIGALVVLGIQQLYLKNATFGSDPLSDYFGLLVWAMSSDVASRTLASLKPGS